MLFGCEIGRLTDQLPSLASDQLVSDCAASCMTVSPPARLSHRRPLRKVSKEPLYKRDVLWRSMSAGATPSLVGFLSYLLDRAS